jgi:signal transduction histidine kinase
VEKILYSKMAISNSPLGKRLLFFILLASTLITLVIIAIQLLFEYKAEVSHIKNRLSLIQNSYIKPLTLSVWTYDTAQYEAQLNGILNIQDITYVVIISKDGKKSIEKGVYQSENTLTQEFKLQSTIHNQNVDLGILVVGASLQRVYDDLYNRAMIILFTQGLKTLIISFVILYLFHILVTRYLSIIANYTKELSLDSNKNLFLEKQNTGDEIDTIVHTINQMQDRLTIQNKQLKTINQELESKVNERTAKLQELMFVQNKMASMGKMIENIAHQWRQPLASVNTSILHLDKRLSDKGIDDESIIEELDSIESTTLYLSKTIDDIRQFYSNEKKQTEFYIYKTVSSSMNIIKGLLKKHNITIIFDIDKSLTLNTYKNDFQQVLLSIVINAKDVLVQKNIPNPQIMIKVYEELSSLKTIIEISDNGGGIKPEIIDRVFDLYFTTKEDIKGTGIGLYISKMIVEQSLNGTIEVTNTSDGALFRLTL